ncbi:hypothetical protein LTR74_018517, partial [Friedmanniomyces endolithicus]
TRGETVPAIVNTEDMAPPSSLSSDDKQIDDGNKIAMYTMKLYEWATRKQKSLLSELTHLTVEPPVWEVKLLVEGETFVGRAKKQRLAKHIACKQAYETLQIDS